MSEFDTSALVPEMDGSISRVPVTVSFEIDGNRPLGLWVYDEFGSDITMVITEHEYDVLYEKACRYIAESLAEAADMLCDKD